MATVEERYIGRRQTGRTAERVFTIRAAADEAEARLALLDESPASLGSMVRVDQDCEVEEITPNDIWSGTAVYALPEFTNQPQPSGSFQLSFDISGQSTRITRSRRTVASFPALNHANFGGAINVNSDGTVEGTDILVPYFNYQVNYTFADADVDQAYVLELSEIVGSVNLHPFHGFDAGELLLTRVGGLQRGSTEADWDIGFSFAVSRNETDIEIGPTVYPGVTFSIPEKRGWDYLWVYYDEYKDTSNNVIHKRPRYAYVEEVYPYTDYDALNI